MNGLLSKADAQLRADTLKQQVEVLEHEMQVLNNIYKRTVKAHELMQSIIDLHELEEQTTTKKEDEPNGSN